MSYKRTDAPGSMRSTLLFALIACLIFLGSAALAEQDALAVYASASPNTLEAAGEVTIMIEMVNESEQAISATLYDPVGQLCELDEQASVLLGPQKSRIYTGRFAVEEHQLDAGGVDYVIRYAYLDAAGETFSVNKPVFIPVIRQQMQKAPELSVSRQVQPLDPQQGDTVFINYDMKNTGSVAIDTITITDTEVLSGQATMTEPLLPGEQTQLTYTFVADEKERRTAAELAYDYVDVLGQRHTKSASMPEIPFAPMPGIQVTLNADSLYVADNEPVTLLCTLSNEGTQAYTQIFVTDPTLGTVAAGLTLSPGETYTVETQATLNGDSIFQFEISGVREGNAEPSTFLSNQLLVSKLVELDASPAVPEPFVAPAASENGPQMPWMQQTEAYDAMYQSDVNGYQGNGNMYTDNGNMYPQRDGRCGGCCCNCRMEYYGEPVG